MNHEITLNFNSSKVVISQYGGQILSWDIVNESGKLEQVLYQGSSHKRSGVPILFPFANPLKNDILLVSGKKIGQHGFARHCQWDLVNKSESKVALELSSDKINTEYKEAYPFSFSLILNIDISIPNCLIYNLSVTNTGNTNLPIAPGLHPYFAINHELKHTLKIAENSEFKGDKIDWEGKSSGMFFDFKNKAAINFPDKVLNIIETSKIPQFENLVVWSQPKTEDDCNFVCFEPFTRQTNAINDNPINVLPNTIWEASFVFKIER